MRTAKGIENIYIRPENQTPVAIPEVMKVLLTSGFLFPSHYFFTNINLLALKLNNG